MRYHTEWTSFVTVVDARGFGTVRSASDICDSWFLVLSGVECIIYLFYGDYCVDNFRVT